MARISWYVVVSLDNTVLGIITVGPVSCTLAIQREKEGWQHLFPVAFSSIICFCFFMLWVAVGNDI